jgi:hypothetical protein
MMEKQNRTVEKYAEGDAGVLDDIVDFAAGKMRAGRASHVKAGRMTDKREEADRQA